MLSVCTLDPSWSSSLCKGVGLLVCCVTTVSLSDGGIEGVVFSLGRCIPGGGRLMGVGVISEERGGAVA